MKTGNKFNKLIKFTGFILLGLLVLNWMPVQPAYAATIVVDTTVDDFTVNGNCSLREAVQAANTDIAVDNCVAGSGADVISLPFGTYTLTRTGTSENATVTGDLDITSNLTIQGSGARSTFVNGGAIDRVFHIPTGGLTVTFNDLTIENGSTPSGQNGSGLLNVGSTVNFNRATIQNNLTPNNGGGIATFDGTINVNNSTISGNRADGAAGILIYGAEMIVTNSTFSGNVAQNYASAINVTADGSPAAVTLNHVTFSGNESNADKQSNQGYVIMTAENGSTATITMNNSLLTGNIGYLGVGINADGCNSADYGGTIYMNSYNVVGSSGSALGCPATGTDTIIAGLPSTVLNVLADNGGPTNTYALVAGSVAVDVSGMTGCAAVDQRGAARPYNGACDAGAYELRESITVGDCDLGPALTGAQDFNFTASSKTVTIDVNTANGLNCITVEEMGGNHLKATGPGSNGAYLATNNWWYITGNVTAGFDVDITLPYAIADNESRVCKWPGNMGGAGWDCADSVTNSSDPNVSVTRTGISSFSDWAVGDNVDPTAVTLQSFTTNSQSTSLFVLLILGVPTLVLSFLWRRRVRR